MKALTLQQPYALVGAMGIKPYETRPRPTKFRGRHLITTSDNWKPEYRKVMEQDIFKVATLGKEIHLGGIIGSIEITDCCSTLEAVKRMAKDVSDGKMQKWEMERAICFGNFEAGRFAYKWENAVLFDAPIRCKGALGVYDTMKIKGNYTIDHDKQPLMCVVNYLGVELDIFGFTQTAEKAIEGLVKGTDITYLKTVQEIEKRLFKL